jgi:hypothetical protein
MGFPKRLTKKSALLRQTAIHRKRKPPVYVAQRQSMSLKDGRAKSGYYG